MNCKNCGEAIYQSDGVWYHESTCDRWCRLPHPVAEPEKP